VAKGVPCLLLSVPLSLVDHQTVQKYLLLAAPLCLGKSTSFGDNLQLQEKLFRRYVMTSERDAPTV
jgi:hypothetical protein